MSKVSIQGDPNGTGDFTIKAPNSNNDRQFDLPDEAGTVLTSASDIEPQVKTATNATGSAPIYACRAWVNFNGTGTVSIRDSGNVSSITDNGTGDYTVNFTTAMPDDDYSLTGLGTWSSVGASGALFASDTGAMTTTSARVYAYQSNNLFNDIDVTTVCVTIHR